MPLFSTPSKVNTVKRRDAATSSRRRGAEEEGIRDAAVYDRDAFYAPTLTCVRLEGVRATGRWSETEDW